jgi:hypothetical protein
VGLIVNPVVFSSISNDWKTPQAIYNQLDFEFHFTFDPCPYQSNELMALLAKEWRGSVFVNPPYDNIDNFMDKALLEFRKGNAKVVVFLVPSATSTDWWHNYVVPFCRDRGPHELRWADRLCVRCRKQVSSAD